MGSAGTSSSCCLGSPCLGASWENPPTPHTSRANLRLDTQHIQPSSRGVTGRKLPPPEPLFQAHRACPGCPEHHFTPSLQCIRPSRKPLTHSLPIHTTEAGPRAPSSLRVFSVSRGAGKDSEQAQQGVAAHPISSPCSAMGEKEVGVVLSPPQVPGSGLQHRCVPVSPRLQ